MIRFDHTHSKEQNILFLFLCLLFFTLKRLPTPITLNPSCTHLHKSLLSLWMLSFTIFFRRQSEALSNF